MKERQTVHDQLEDLRKERGLTLEELSKLTGISKTTLSDCEKKPDKDISHRHLLTLAKFYGVSIDYLFGLTENRKVCRVGASLNRTLIVASAKGLLAVPELRRAMEAESGTGSVHIVDAYTKN